MTAAFSYGVNALAIVLFLLSIRRTVERIRRLSESPKSTEKAEIANFARNSSARSPTYRFVICLWHRKSLARKKQNGRSRRRQKETPKKSTAGSAACSSLFVMAARERVQPLLRTLRPATRKKRLARGTWTNQSTF